MSGSDPTYREESRGNSWQTPIKVTALVFVVICTVIAAVVWKTQELLVADKSSFIADSEMKQVAPIKRLVQERLGEQKAQLVRFATTRFAMGHGRMFGDFSVIAMFENKGTGQWTPLWIDSAASGAANARLDTVLLQSLPYNKVQNGEVLWSRLSDRQGAPVYALMVSVEIQNKSASIDEIAANNSVEGLPDTPSETSTMPAGSGRKAVVVGLANESPLAAVTEDYIGSNSNIYIVDERGYVASHENKAYLGALFTNDQIVHEILTTKKSAGSGHFEDLESRIVIGHYEKIDHSNLYTVISTPLQSATGILESHLKTALAAGSAAGLLGIVLAWLVGRSITAQPSTVRRRRTSKATEVDAQPEAELADASPAPLSVSQEIMQVLPPFPKPESSESVNNSAAATVILSRPAPNKELMRATPTPFDRSEFTSTENTFSVSPGVPVSLTEEPAVRSGFLDAVAEPMNAIIGHANLVRDKIENTEAKAHVESIERDARQLRDIVGKMQEWRSEVEEEVPDDTVSRVSIDLAKTVEEIVERLRPELKLNKVELTMNLDKVPFIYATMEPLSLIIGHVVDNAKEAMRNRPVKHLIFSLKHEGGKNVLRVSDTGIGMAQETIDHAFDPFFKRFESSNRLGLGLSVVRSTIKRMGGECKIKSTIGEGATFELIFSTIEKRLVEDTRTTIDVLNPIVERPANVKIFSAPVEPKITESKIPESQTAEPPVQPKPEDDEVDNFSSVVLTPAGISSQSSQNPSGFQVKIRRPKLKG